VRPRAVCLWPDSPLGVPRILGVAGPTGGWILYITMRTECLSQIRSVHLAVRWLTALELDR
jgi:hypothetical protein